MLDEIKQLVEAAESGKAFEREQLKKNFMAELSKVLIRTSTPAVSLLVGEGSDSIWFIVKTKSGVDYYGPEIAASTVAGAWFMDQFRESGFRDAGFHRLSANL